MHAAQISPGSHRREDTWAQFYLAHWSPLLSPSADTIVNILTP